LGRKAKMLGTSALESGEQVVTKGHVSVTIGITPFFGFLLALVISGTLVILLAALLWTGR